MLNTTTLLSNECCARSYQHLLKYYDEKKQWIDSVCNNHILSHNKTYHTQPNTIHNTQQQTITNNQQKFTQLTATNSFNILQQHQSSARIASINDLNQLQSFVSEMCQQQQPSDATIRKLSSSNTNKNSTALNLNALELVETIEHGTKIMDFLKETTLKPNGHFSSETRRIFSILCAKYNVPVRNVGDVLKLVASLPEFGKVKVLDSICEETVRRSIVENALSLKVALAILLSKSFCLAWTCDETTYKGRSFLIMTMHGITKKTYQSWHAIASLLEITHGNAQYIIDKFKERLYEFQQYQKDMNIYLTNSYDFIGFGGDHASVNTGEHHGVLALFNKMREIDWKENTGKDVSLLPPCIFYSCIDHTCALISKRMHLQISNMCEQFSLFKMSSSNYLSLVHYICKTISWKFRGKERDLYRVMQEEYGLKFKPLPFVDINRYCTIDICASTILERLYFFLLIRRYITDPALMNVLNLLESPEIILLLSMSTLLWNCACSHLMKIGDHIQSRELYFTYLKQFTTLISQSASPFMIMLESSPKLLFHYFQNSPAVKFPSQILYSINICEVNHSILYSYGIVQMDLLLPWVWRAACLLGRLICDNDIPAKLKMRSVSRKFVLM